MGLLGDKRKEVLKQEPNRVKRRDVIICNEASETLTKGRKYSVLGYHTYCKKRSLGGGDFYFYWYEFVTIKNNYDYTIKVNLKNFSVEKEIIEAKRIKDEYEEDGLNILMEAHNLIEQKYE